MIEIVMQHDHDCSRKGEFYIHEVDNKHGVYQEPSIRCEQTQMELLIIRRDWHQDE